MSGGGNGAPLSLWLSVQALDLLDQLAAHGVYGNTRHDVAARFIDQALQDFVDRPRLVLVDEDEPKRKLTGWGDDELV